MAAAVADPDPVLYYEHIALYRDPRIKQVLADEPPAPIADWPRGASARRPRPRHRVVRRVRARGAARRREARRRRDRGERCSTCAASRRSIAPRSCALARRCHRVLIVHEDTRTGGIGESLAAIIQEEAFEWLDAPVRIVGALDTPVPYSPPLEEFFLPSEAQVERAARLLAAY